MIRRLISRLLPGNQGGVKVRKKPKVVAASEHGIRREHIDEAALSVAEKLKESGYQAFIVGGAVRDLTLGVTPKDFDIATNATPEQVKACFRRAFIVGRRFRLVHVLIGGETIEVSTFRGNHDGSAAPKDEHGRILADNVFGTQGEDAARRDFTVNALYYDPEKQEIWDYQDGYADLKKKRMRLIGDPERRYREDPVRMLRAVRLAAKLGFGIEKKTGAPIPELAELLKNVPAARLFEEMQKLLLSGHAVETLRSLRQHGLHRGLLPLLDAIMEQPLGQRFIDLALANTDERVLAGKPVSPAFLFAALLWHEVLPTWNGLKEQGEHAFPALQSAMEEVIERQAEQTAIPRRYGSTIKEIWALQPRFEQRYGQRPFRLVEQPRFRAAYDFLLLRCQSGELPMELAEWWEQFQSVGPAERDKMLLKDENGGNGARKRRRRPRRRKSDGGATVEGNE